MNTYNAFSSRLDQSCLSLSAAHGWEQGTLVHSSKQLQYFLKHSFAGAHRNGWTHPAVVLETT